MSKPIEYLLWEHCFGDVEVALDFSGRKMIKTDLNDEDSPFGWGIYHILAPHMGGAERASNFHPVNNLTSQEKGFKTTFCANSCYYTIVLTKRLLPHQKSKVLPYFFEKKYAIVKANTGNN